MHALRAPRMLARAGAAGARRSPSASSAFMLRHALGALRRSAARLAAATLLAVGAAPAHAQFSSVTFFGDSFTDTGNGDLLSGLLLGADLTPSPPYAPGVASNGAVWAQTFAAALGRPGDATAALGPGGLGGRNYAVGTARTGIGPVFQGLGAGMQAQAAVHAGGCPPALAAFCPPARTGDATGLYVLFGGANDVRDAAALGDAAARTAALETAANNLATIATGLYGQGARRFLLPSLPNLGRTPDVVGTPTGRLLGELTDEFNGLLRARLGLLRTAPGIDVFGLRLDNLFENVLRDARRGGTRYGITDVTRPCLPPPFGLGLDCSTALFADALHPTTRAHDLIAAAAYARVVRGTDVTVIPEPATVVLLGGGLLALGAVGARRRGRAA